MNVAFTQACTSGFVSQKSDTNTMRVMIGSWTMIRRSHCVSIDRDHFYPTNYPKQSILSYHHVKCNPKLSQ